jgi:hypothetical protein
MRRHRERTRGTLTARESLLEILQAAGVPGGLAEPSQCGEAARHPKPSGTSPRQRLESLAAAEPRYRWQMENGVVNFLPKDDVPMLLGVRLARFAAADVSSADEALGALLATPELKRAMSDPRVGTRLLRGGIGFYNPNYKGTGGKRFSVSLRNVTVRDALNAIAHAHGRSLWSYRGANCRGGSEFELEFISW